MHNPPTSRNEAIEPITISIRTACSPLDIGPTKFLQLVAAGKIAAIKVGQLRLVVLSTLKEFVAAKREGE